MKAEDVIEMSLTNNHWQQLTYANLSFVIAKALRAAGLLNEWVPVAERLPETKGRYLCIFLSGNMSYDLFDPKRTLFVEDWQKYVTHWQAIAPPKE